MSRLRRFGLRGGPFFTAGATEQVLAGWYFASGRWIVGAILSCFAIFLVSLGCLFAFTSLPMRFIDVLMGARRRNDDDEPHRIHYHSAAPDDEKAAWDRATNLLLEHLSPEQREDYLRTRCFSVRGANGRTYILDGWHRAANVWRVCKSSRFFGSQDLPRLTSGETYSCDAHFCIVPYDSWIPSPDHLLIEKLMLESKKGLRTFQKIAVSYPDNRSFTCPRSSLNLPRIHG